MLYTLVCLGTWTDEILEMLVFKGAGSNLLIYEEMCGTSFIQSGRGGQKSVCAFMLDAVMAECPQRLKRQLFSRIVEQIADQEADDTFWLLYRSAVRIAQFCLFEHREWMRLAPEFVKAAKSLKERAAFDELSDVCRDFLQMADNGNMDNDVCNAALTCQFFAQAFQNRDGEKEFAILQKRTEFGLYSWQSWSFMSEAAEDAGAYEQAYLITALLEEKFLEGRQAADSDSFRYHYLILAKKFNLMQKLGGRFENQQIEKEIEKLAGVIDEGWDAPEAEKKKAANRADYYFRREDIPVEAAAQKMEECIRKYRLSCTDEQAKQDVALYGLEVMAMFKRGIFDFETAYQGLRLLYELYGGDMAGREDTEIFLRVIALDIPKEEWHIDVYCKVYEAYYKRLYMDGNLETYYWLDGVAFTGSFVRDILRKGIAYLSNLPVSGGDIPFRLFLCHTLLKESILGDELLYDEDKRGGHEMIQYAILNNQMLLMLFGEAAKSYGRLRDEAARQRLFLFLRVMFCPRELTSAKCFGIKISEEEKALLAELLGLCGTGTDYMAWKARYAGKSFSILDHICGWQFGLETEIDGWAVNAALYIAWKVGGELAETAETCIMDMLKDHFRYFKTNQEAGFWFALLREAKRGGEEWERHIRSLSQKALSGFVRDKLNLDGATRKNLAEYDAQFAERDAENDGEFYNMACHIRSIGEKELLEDYCRRFLLQCAEQAWLYENNVLGHLDWLTDILPFHEVWNKELCVKSIRFSNYEKIYKSICPYLSEDELLDVFAVSVWKHSSVKRVSHIERPKEAEVAFFESEYFAWLNKKFPDAAKQALQREFPKLYEARDEYMSRRNAYRGQVNKALCEIKEEILECREETETGEKK